MGYLGCVLIAGSLESAYSLNWGALKICRQDLGTFMISRPILHESDWWEFRYWNGVREWIQSFFSMQIRVRGV